MAQAAPVSQLVILRRHSGISMHHVVLGLVHQLGNYTGWRKIAHVLDA
jgi:hypothetical protein